MISTHMSRLNDEEKEKVKEAMKCKELYSCCAICESLCLKEKSNDFMEDVLTLDTPKTGYSYKCKVCNVCFYRLLTDYEFRVNARYIRENINYRPLPIKLDSRSPYILEVDSGWHNTDMNSRATYVLWHPCPRDLNNIELIFRRQNNVYDIYPFNSMKYKR